MAIPHRIKFLCILANDFMIEYACGHKTEGVIIMDSSILSIVTYLQWVEDEDNLRIQKECFDCFLKRVNGVVMKNEEDVF